MVVFVSLKKERIFLMKNMWIKWHSCYFCAMQLTNEHQELVDFFAERELPAGPQHVNEFSVFFNLTGAVRTRLQELQSEVELTRNSAATMLAEVRSWLLKQASA